ncbi:P-loop containing nucleoside triphosphate hydrolase protein [Mycena rosella]|uniref:P-loop containing nucleoside triphosphate hydrolase protein n=1 Tax=Mycena rosella TaxID=1033263 RepID=A0AAD7CZV0_MYCRO|nr:P-loop containing nucleoside triphosphate hydrolase protein [Mycena rosella]
MAPGMRFRSKRQRATPGEGTFDPEDVQNVRHTKIGIWDLYEQIEPKLKLVPWSLRSKMETFHEMRGSFPYIVRMFKDIGSIGRTCYLLFAGYVLVVLILALIPAIELWYSGLLLKIVQTAVENRSVDRHLLIQVAASRLLCAAINRLLLHGQALLYRPLNEKIRQHYAVQTFQARARLDVPTYADSAVQRQLDNSSTSSRTSIAWNNVLTTLHLVSTGIELVSQFSVLISMLRDQRDGPLLATLSFGHTLFRKRTSQRHWGPTGVWAATTKDTHYLRSVGMARVVHDQNHRKELVAGGLSDFLNSSYRAASERLGNHATDFFEAFHRHTVTDRLSLTAFLSDPLRELPQIVFTLRAVQYPSDIPLSLASLNLITQTTTKFSQTLFNLVEESGSVAENLASIRKLVGLGVAVEFRNVSFRYPDSNNDVLRNVSFKILQGQLCVIVGKNGSGKSTILKLIARLYDPTEGEIFIDNQDIRTLKLADLRRATSVLFQDYTHFPLSIKDNIALGDPNNAHDEEKIREAARLGGATEFIERLDEGFDTYLDRPVDDIYSTLPQGTKTLFGRPVEYGRLRFAGGMSSHAQGLSGGQMQRIALSRTFMRDEGVGLLCFDEPSASLDPTAEHDLFERLRLLRGNKTMIFSSHRFGNLTRHADLILYMDDAEIMEEGTHDELIKRGGGYAKIWMLQAQAFLP